MHATLRFASFWPGVWFTSGILPLCIALGGCAADKDAILEQANQGGTASDAWQIDEQARLLGRGLNLGNCLDAPIEGDWGAVLSEEDFVQAEALGFDSVRIPVRWSAHVAVEPPYQIEESFLARVDWAVEQAYAHHLRAVIDVHHFETLMDDPATYEPVLKSIWSQLAEHYQSHGPELYFELLNEPTSKLTTELWNDYIAELVPLIRETNPNRSLIIGGATFNDIDGLRALKLPEDPYVIGTFHFYDPNEFTFQGQEWVDGSEAWLGTLWYGSEGEVSMLEKKLDLAVDWRDTNARPLYLGEFGSGSVADYDSRVRYTAFMAKYAEEHAISYAIWDDHNTMGIRDPETKELYREIVEALMNPAEVFADKRTEPPIAELPAGDSVLVDDFEDAFGDQPNESHLLAAKAHALDTAKVEGGWYIYGEPGTHWYGFDNVELVTFEQYEANGTLMNVDAAVGDFALGGRGLHVQGALSNSVGTYGGFGTVLQGTYGEDWLDMTKLEAVSFRARGTGTLRLGMIARQVLEDANGNNWGYLGQTVVLGPNFASYVLYAKDFVPKTWSQQALDGVKWSDVCNEITAIDFDFPSDNLGEVKVELDDFRLHGMSYADFGFAFEAP